MFIKKTVFLLLILGNFNEKLPVLFTLNEKPHFKTKKSILVLFTLPFILSLSLKLKVFKPFSLVFL